MRCMAARHLSYGALCQFARQATKGVLRWPDGPRRLPDRLPADWRLHQSAGIPSERLKVGPNYGRPPAPVARDWIDAADKRLRSDSDDLSAWYTVFKTGSRLPHLLCLPAKLDPAGAGSRVLQARDQLAIATGNFFPQTQDMTGDYTRNAVSTRTANHSNVSSQFFSQWDYVFTWPGRLTSGPVPPAIESANAAWTRVLRIMTRAGDVAW